MFQTSRPYTSSDICPEEALKDWVISVRTQTSFRIRTTSRVYLGDLRFSASMGNDAANDEGPSLFACSECKTRKVKCDRTKPICNRCTKDHASCHYPTSRKRPLQLPSRPRLHELENRLGMGSGLALVGIGAADGIYTTQLSWRTSSGRRRRLNATSQGRRWSGQAALRSSRRNARWKSCA